MHLNDWLQLALFIGVLALITRPMGCYLTQVLDPHGKTWLDPLIRRFEKLTYRLMGVDVAKEHGWKAYTFAALVFSTVGLLFTYAILRLQHLLPLNPQGFPASSPALAFNTAVSFTTNTNWQSYGGESTMSYFSQMVGLTIHNFTSAAVGIPVAAALVREVSRASATTLGNFWVDLTRTTYYLLLPLCLVFAVFLVSQGTIRNFKAYDTATLAQAIPEVAAVPATGDTAATDVVPAVTTQRIVQGPMASQAAIKMLDTNGGGYTNANSVQPFENTTPAGNFIQMLSSFAIGSGLTWYLGKSTKNQAHGWSAWAAMMFLFVAGVLAC